MIDLILIYILKITSKIEKSLVKKIPFSNKEGNVALILQVEHDSRFAYFFFYQFCNSLLHDGEKCTRQYVCQAPFSILLC